MIDGTRRARVYAPGEIDAALEPYDFRTPELLTELQRRLLDGAFGAFARQCGVQLTAKTRVVTQVRYDSFALQPFGLVSPRFGPTDGLVLCVVEGVAGRLVYRIPTVEALLWTSRMVGGTGRVAAVRRPLTAIERALLWQMADEHLGELRLALGELLPDVAVESFAQVLPAGVVEDDQLMVVADFVIERETGAVELTMAVPAAPILGGLGHGPIAHQGDPSGAMAHHVQASSVTVAVRFDDTRVAPGVVLGLHEGDVIPLDHPPHRPLAVALGGEAVARAAVGANGDRLACVVVSAEEAAR